VFEETRTPTRSVLRSHATARLCVTTQSATVEPSDGMAEISAGPGSSGGTSASNGNPKSADYNPANLNQLARLLRHNGQPAPAEVPVKKWQLSLRSEIIAELTAESIRAAGKPADPGRLGDLPVCAAVVVDVVRHRATTSC
jgi:hypothetical protein